MSKEAALRELEFDIQMGFVEVARSQLRLAQSADKVNANAFNSETRGIAPIPLLDAESPIGAAIKGLIVQFYEEMVDLAVARRTGLKNIYDHS